MSYTSFDADMDRMVEEILEDNKDQIIDEFVTERMASYYAKHPGFDVPAKNAIQDARDLLNSHPTASLVFSGSATEMALRDVLLKPVVYGMVHEESTAEGIAGLVIRNSKFQTLLFDILKKHGVDLEKIKRPKSANTLWMEIKKIKDIRNRVLHSGEKATREDAEISLELAEIIIEGVFPHLKKKIGI